MLLDFADVKHIKMLREAQRLWLVFPWHAILTLFMHLTVSLKDMSHKKKKADVYELCNLKTGLEQSISYKSQTG